MVITRNSRVRHKPTGVTGTVDLRRGNDVCVVWDDIPGRPALANWVNVGRLTRIETDL